MSGKRKHLSAPGGKRVIVHFNNGEKLVTRFIKQDKRWVYVEGHEPIRCRDIRTIGIYRGGEP